MSVESPSRNPARLVPRDVADHARHSLTHWYPATFYLILPIIGKELGLSYSQIGLIMTCQYIAAPSRISRRCWSTRRTQGRADGDLALLGGFSVIC